MNLTVHRAGLQTTVQDSGRVGYRHLGIGRSGALDGFSARIANLLVGNAPDAALLEVALHGPLLRFESTALVAWCGAQAELHVGTQPIPGWRPVRIAAAAELDIGACRSGARGYLAVAGGIDVAPQLGSRSTDLRGGFGGWRGRALHAGDRLPIGAQRTPPRFASLRPAPAQAAFAPWWIDGEGELGLRLPALVRLLAGPARLGDADEERLTSEEFRISPNSDRMGLRLQGTPLQLAAPTGGISEPVVPGTVQLQADGQPIVLLGDCQTVGGYPRLGEVIAADLPRLAQLRPGDGLRLHRCDLNAAQAAACERERVLSRIALAIEQRAAE